MKGCNSNIWPNTRGNWGNEKEPREEEAADGEARGPCKALHKAVSEIFVSIEREARRAGGMLARFWKKRGHLGRELLFSDTFHGRSKTASRLLSPRVIV